MCNSLLTFLFLSGGAFGYGLDKLLRFTGVEATKPRRALIREGCPDVVNGVVEVG